jgi:formylglycine-generating enzyme required for sulfatase activity
MATRNYNDSSIATCASLALLVVVAIPACDAGPFDRDTESQHQSSTIAVSGGTSWTGSGIARALTAVADFQIDTTEVTTAQYRACVEAGHCSADGVMTASFSHASDEALSLWSRICNYGMLRPTHPMNCVTWSEAREFCRWAGKRLPLDEEWTYAAHGPEKRAAPWGDSSPGPHHLNACGPECRQLLMREFHITSSTMYDADDGWPATAPAASYPLGRTPERLWDMAGNVWEWTQGKRCLKGQDSAGCLEGRRVARGGGFLSVNEEAIGMDDSIELSVATRAPDVGFRCARGGAEPISNDLASNASTPAMQRTSLTAMQAYAALHRHLLKSSMTPPLRLIEVTPASNRRSSEAYIVDAWSFFYRDESGAYTTAQVTCAGRVQLIKWDTNSKSMWADQPSPNYQWLVGDVQIVAWRPDPYTRRDIPSFLVDDWLVDNLSAQVAVLAAGGYLRNESAMSSMSLQMSKVEGRGYQLLWGTWSWGQVAETPILVDARTGTLLQADGRSFALKLTDWRAPDDYHAWYLPRGTVPSPLFAIGTRAVLDTRSDSFVMESLDRQYQNKVLNALQIQTDFAPPAHIGHRWYRSGAGPFVYDNAYIRAQIVALQRHPTRTASSWFSTGVMYAAVGNWDRAINDVTQGLEMEHRAEWRYVRAILLLAVRDFDAAEQDMRDLPRALPGVVELQQQLLQLRSCLVPSSNELYRVVSTDMGDFPLQVWFGPVPAYREQKPPYGPSAP